MSTSAYGVKSKDLAPFLIYLDFLICFIYNMNMVKYPRLSDREWLEGRVKDTPLRYIAEELGCSYSAVVHATRKMDIKVPARVKYRMTIDKSENIKKALAKKYPEGRFGSLASNWKGGRRKQHGYIMIYAPNHPRAGRAKRVFEHILVAESVLGRHLLPDEVVHHINHNKSDNRPENLQVLTRSEHVKLHYDIGNELVNRIKYLEGLLEKHGINFKK